MQEIDLIYFFNLFSAMKDSFDNLKHRDLGAVSSILKLLSEVNMKDSVLEMFDFLLVLDKKKPHFSDIDCPDFELNEISQVISEVSSGKRS